MRWVAPVWFIMIRTECSNMTDEDKDIHDIYERAVELINNSMQGNKAELITDHPLAYSDGKIKVSAILTNAPYTHIGIAIAQAMSEHPELSIDDSWEMSPPNVQYGNDDFKVHF